MTKAELKWKDIPGYEGLYQVSESGIVRSLDRIVTQQGRGKAFDGKRKGRELKQHEQNNGYMIVQLCKNGEKKAVTVHRLVAEAFLGRKECHQDVNHIDGNKKNNSANNLEWTTRRNNILHSYRILKRKKSNCKSVKCRETQEMFNSIREAGKSTGTNPASISSMLNGRNKTAGGYTWEWA